MRKGESWELDACEEGTMWRGWVRRDRKCSEDGHVLPGTVPFSGPARLPRGQEEGRGPWPRVGQRLGQSGECSDPQGPCCSGSRVPHPPLSQVGPWLSPPGSACGGGRPLLSSLCKQMT